MMFQRVRVAIALDRAGVSTTRTAATSRSNALPWHVSVHSTRVRTETGRDSVVDPAYLMVRTIQLSLVYCALMSSDKPTGISSTVVHQRRLLIQSNFLYG